jgi:AcrR family transcriptional regulator
VTRSRAATRQRREDVAARVLRATEELMADGTAYTELPMQRIAEHAGVARSSVYLHFPDKSQLLIALAEQATAGIFATALTWWEAEHDGGPAEVERVMAGMLEEYRAHLYLLLALTEVSAYDPDVAGYWLGRVGEFIDVAQQRLVAEQASGTVSAELDPASTARALTWMVERTIAVHCRTDPGTGDAKLAHDLGRAIWLTVYGDAPAQ